MSDVGIKSTKHQIYSAYQRALEELKDLKSTQLDPKEEKAKVRKAEVKELILSDKVDDALEQLYSLSDSVPGAIQQYVSDIKEQSKKAEELGEAVELLKKELEDLYGISAEAESLAALVDSHKKLKDELGAEQAKTEKAWLEEKAARGRVYVREAAEAEQAHSRRITEWEYEFTRHTKLKMDELEDQMASRKKEFQAGMDEIAKQEAERCEMLNKRGVAIGEREKKMAELEETIDKLEASREQELAEAASKAKAQAAASYAIETNALKKGHEAEVSILKSQVALLRD